jgi:hypothetical protein
MNSGSATTITVNTDLFNAGDTLFIQNRGAGVCTITAGTATVSTAGSLALAGFQGGTLYFVSAGVAIFYPSSAGAGKILQVVSVTKTDTFTTTSASLVDVTDLTATITPSATANKILVLTSIPFGNSNAVNELTGITLADGSNNNLIAATSPGSRTPSMAFASGVTNGSMNIATFSLLHSPNTTSAFTYKIRMSSTTGSTSTVNRSGDDSNAASRGRGVATITLMEVAP